MSADPRAVAGYAPVWHDEAEALIAGSRLMALRGGEVREGWTLWTDTGWADRAPVVLVVGGTRLEVCARGVTEFSVTRDTIRMDAAAGAPPAWRRNANHELAAIVNRTVTDVGAVEYQLDPTTRRRFGRQWVLSGIYLRFGDAHLEIFNGLDCNRLSNMPDRDHPVRYISCARWPALVGD